MRSTIPFKQAGALLGCGICLSSFAGDFVNLGFDTPLSLAVTSKNVPDLLGDHIYSYGSATQLVPGWSFTIGATPFLWSQEPDMVGKVLYYDTLGPAGPGLTLAGVGLLGQHSLYVFGSNYNSIDQRMEYFPVTLTQSGRIPEGAATLRFVNGDYSHRVKVSLNGSEVFSEAVAFDSQEYTADVSALAGLEVSLEFGFAENHSGAFDVYGFFDHNGNLIAIPEPSTSALLGLGGAGLGWWLRRRRA